MEPQQRFNRIRAQSRAFIISAFHERLERSAIRNRTRNVPTYFHYPIKVTHARKENILAELGMVNITRETLFPSLDEAASAVTQRYLSLSLGKN